MFHHFNDTAWSILTTDCETHLDDVYFDKESALTVLERIMKAGRDPEPLLYRYRLHKVSDNGEQALYFSDDYAAATWPTRMIMIVDHDGMIARCELSLKHAYRSDLMLFLRRFSFKSKELLDTLHRNLLLMGAALINSFACEA